MSIDLSRVGVSGPLSARSRLIHRFASRQQRNRQSLSAVRDVPARLDYADVIAAVTATKARSPTLVGIIWKSA
jgi:hypothetical protein